MSPSCEFVWALKPLQNSMILTPCWPSAGPTGGEGLALPAVICSFTIAWTFFAMSEPFDLVVLELDGGEAPEDGHHHFQLTALRIEVVDGPLEIDEGPLDHPHLVPLLEGGLELGLLRALLHLAQDALDFFGRQRHRLRARAHEARDLRRGSHQMPRVVGELHFDQQVAGEELLLRFDLLTAPDLPHLLRRHDDAAEHILEAEALGPGLDPLPHLLLETGVSVDHEPLLRRRARSAHFRTTPTIRERITSTSPRYRATTKTRASTTTVDAATSARLGQFTRRNSAATSRKNCWTFLKNSIRDLFFLRRR